MWILALFLSVLPCTFAGTRSAEESTPPSDGLVWPESWVTRDLATAFGCAMALRLCLPHLSSCTLHTKKSLWPHAFFPPEMPEPLRARRE